MIPERFVIEYPQRCMEMLDMVEPLARKKNLVGSFALMVASSIFVIPYERMKKAHPLEDIKKEPAIYKAIRRIEGQRFLSADIWGDEPPGDWRYTRIMSDANETARWRNEDQHHPMKVNAHNSIGDREVGDVLRVIRNALAHGNVVYLDREGFETRGSELQYLAFLSRYEESPKQRERAETYRLLATTEEAFLRFVKAWAHWLQQFPPDNRLYAAAAEPRHDIVRL